MRTIVICNLKGGVAKTATTVNLAAILAADYGKRVLVIDDVLDTGLTMKEVCDALLKNGASRVASTVAVNKSGRRSVQYEADFCALHCDDCFLVGYGLDYNGKYRNLPYIGYVE